MFTQRLSSLEFFTYAAFFAVVVGSISAILPGRKAPTRTEPYTEDELNAHDRRLPKYFLAGGAFLLLGGVHMALKNLPWAAEWLARAGYAGHLVRDLANTHVMIVGGGTLLATGLTWYALPRIVGRPLASDGLAQCAFWLTAAGLLVRVPKPQAHLSKFFVTGAAALTVGTVQGVIQVTPAHADWLYRAGHAGEWIDPISHAHINLVTGLTMLTAGA